jgi:hypothetical protein
VLGRIHLARGEWEPSEAALQQSWDTLSSVGSQYELAQTELALVHLALARGITPDERDEIESNLSHIAEALTTLGAQAVLREAEDLTQALRLHESTS